MSTPGWTLSATSGFEPFKLLMSCLCLEEEEEEHSVLHPVLAMTPYKIWESDSPEHPYLVATMS